MTRKSAPTQQPDLGFPKPQANDGPVGLCRPAGGGDLRRCAFAARERRIA